MAKKLTDEQKQQIKDLALQGVHDTEIAERVGVSVPTAGVYSRLAWEEAMQNKTKNDER